MTWPLSSDPVTALRTGLAAAIEQAGVTAGGAVRRGKSIIATSESRTNVAYGLLTTPDRVQNIVLPTDGLIAVGYQALWKESVIGAARAAIFIGSDQLKVQRPGSSAPVSEAAAIGGSIADTEVELVAGGIGLMSREPTVALAADTAGPVALGIASMSDVTSAPLVAEIDGGVKVGPAELGATGPLCLIRAPAGTYDVSVQFKASSGSVTVKNRRLWIWTLGF